MAVSLEQRIKNFRKGIIESEDFLSMLKEARESRRFSDLSAIVVDATETSRWDVFRFLQKEVLHLGAVSVATLLKEAGFRDVKAVYEVLTPDYDYSGENPDFVGVSSIVTNLPYANKKIEEFRRRWPNALILAGGAGYAFNPNVAIKHGADACVVGKADYSLLEVLNRTVSAGLPGENLRESFLSSNAGDVQGVFEATNPLITTGFAPMVRDLDVLQIDYGLIQGEQAKSMRSIRDSEGCTHNCDFCSTVRLHQNKYRACSAERVVEEMRKAKEEGIRQAFFIGDHALARPYDKVVELCEAIRAAKLGMTWVCQATVRSIDDNLDKGIMQLLEKAGCSVLCLGMESIDDSDLKGMNAQGKNSYARSKRVFGALRDSPIEGHVMAVLPPIVDAEQRENMPFSAENSSEGIRIFREKVNHMVDFLIEYDARTAMFSSAVPLPGTKDTEKYFNAGIVLKKVGGKRVGFNKYNGQYVVASANPWESNNIMIGAYRRLYSWKYTFDPLFRDSRKNKLGQMLFRAIGKGTVFAGSHSKEAKEYMGALERGDFEFYKPGEKPIFD